MGKFAKLDGEVKVMVDEFSQAQVPGQGGRQEQAGIGHQSPARPEPRADNLAGRLILLCYFAAEPVGSEVGELGWAPSDGTGASRRVHAVPGRIKALSPSE